MPCRGQPLGDHPADAAIAHDDAVPAERRRRCRRARRAPRVSRAGGSDRRAAASSLGVSRSASQNTSGLRMIEMIAPARIRSRPSSGRMPRSTPSSARMKENSPTCARLTAMIERRADRHAERR